MAPLLAAELLRIVIALTPPEDLLSVRAASRTLRSIATPAAFRIAKANSTVESVVALCDLLQSDLRVHVREVVYQDWYCSQESEKPESTPPEDDQAEVQVHLVRAIERLPTLPALHNVSLIFHDTFTEPTSAYIDDERSPYLDLQRATLTALATAGPMPALRALTLDNIIVFPDAIYADPRFLDVLRGVHALRLTLLSDTDLEGAVFQDPIVEFFSDALPLLLAAPAAMLTTLELRGDQDVGGIPGLLPALGELRCPSLQRLALRHVLFAGDTGAEAFVLAHVDTLTSLRLENCKVSISSEEDGPDRVWAQIYGALAEGLVNLRELDVEEDHEGANWPDGNPEGRKLRYTKFDDGYGWNSYFGEDEDMSNEAWVLRDDEGLDAFRTVVRARAGSEVDGVP
ncbi:hypothetical protein FA95DRAFT_1606051 [Auriscalpium vulgare]|uniref:Uncharacterized protein n=1 Tax=Auriscalpium vulgare TaxID=40419 RepID=A0ACB8RT39_9AGAM|nr:hypothetical protein FA95DRAFT_1606051 [Auriscalpium vulgare]